MYPNHNYKRGLLIRYLNQYLSKKDLRMKNVLINIKQRIETNRPITIRQFNSLIKFIEREKEFINSDRNEIQQFFDKLIEPIKKRINPYEHNDLTQFLHWLQTYQFQRTEIPHQHLRQIGEVQNDLISQQNTLLSYISGLGVGVSSTDRMLMNRLKKGFGGGGSKKWLFWKSIRTIFQNTTNWTQR